MYKNRWLAMVLVVVLVLGVGAASAQEPTRNYRAHLNAEGEVADVDSQAQGQAIYQFNEDFTALSFKLNIANIEDVIGAHIHLAPEGVNGPIVLPLFGNPFVPDPGVTVNGTLVEGTLTAANLTGPLAGMTLWELAAAMEAGNTYTNVHTVSYRPGEIRGQNH